MIPITFGSKPTTHHVKLRDFPWCLLDMCPRNAWFAFGSFKHNSKKERTDPQAKDTPIDPNTDWGIEETGSLVYGHVTYRPAVPKAKGSPVSRSDSHAAALCVFLFPFEPTNKEHQLQRNADPKKPRRAWLPSGLLPPIFQGPRKPCTRALPPVDLPGVYIHTFEPLPQDAVSVSSQGAFLQRQ